MPSPIYAIALRRTHDRDTLQLFVRRTPKPKKGKNANGKWNRGWWPNAEDMEITITTYSDYFPKKQTAEWVVMQYMRTTNLGSSTYLRLTRINRGDHPCMPFNEAYELFLAHMRMFVTQTKES